MPPEEMLLLSMVWDPGSGTGAAEVPGISSREMVLPRPGPNIPVLYEEIIMTSLTGIRIINFTGTTITTTTTKTNTIIADIIIIDGDITAVPSGRNYSRVWKISCCLFLVW
jgi:hypothetical protein